MAFLPAKDAEPIVGYRLVEKLGVGGYGEVWKVIAPGGLAKAVKIVYGDMSGSRAEQELKALGRIKQVRHPFLLSLERIEVVDGQLFIVTELADGCLLDRFFDCRKKGLKGIPRDELLGHLRDAADALDYMGETHGLQHLDIKPQNLLLVGNRLKVADFGLVKDLGGAANTGPGGVTPVYATPEAFDGRVSRYSDQYSLAIVYQEMLTGVRPFPGTTMMQLMAQHVTSPPLLTPLPGNDRSAIAKALSKVPEHRFPSCLKMVDALLAGGRDAAVPAPAAARRLAPSEQDIALPVEAWPPPAPPDTSAGLDLATLPKTSVAADRAAVGAQDLAQRLASRAASAGDPGLRPTLFLGIGGLAAAALRRVKKRLRARYGGPADAPIYRFLLVDTDREDLRRARQGDPAEALEVAETLFTPLHLPEHYRAESKKLLRWLDRRWFYGIPRSLLTEGLRPLGRLALVDNAADVLSHLRDNLEQITTEQAVEKTVNVTGAGIRNKTPRVFVIASAAGGTGGGMTVSMAYAVRQALEDLGLSANGLCGLLLYATSPKLTDQEMARVNAYATLSEVAYFNRPDAFYPGDPENELRAFGKEHSPFEETYLVHLGDQLGAAEAEAATESLAEYLFFDSSPNGGAFLDEFRSQTRAAPGEPFTFRSFGLSRIGTEGERPLDMATKLLCLRLTEKWLAGPGEAEARYLEREAHRQAAAQGLEEQTLVAQMQTVVAAALGESLEEYFPKLLTRAAEVAGGDLPHQMLGPIDRALATKTDAREGQETPASPFQAAVRKGAAERGAGMSRPLLDWMIRQVEIPGKRFRAAERAATFLAGEFTSLMETVRGRLAHTGGQRQALRQQIEAEKSSGKSATLGWLGRALGMGAPNTEDQLQSYCRLWLEEAAEAGALVALGVVEKELKAFLQTLALCRRRLEKFAEPFWPALRNEVPPNAATLPLLGPGDGEDAAAGAVGASDSLPPELVFRFDRSFQCDVLERRGGMWGVFSRDDEASRSAADAQPPREALAEDLLIRARSAIQGVIKELNAAQLFLQTNGGPEQALPLLLAQVEAARPRLRAPAGWEHLVLGLPEGLAGVTLSDMIAKALPDVPGSVVHTEEEVVLCYEAARCPVREMTRALIGPAGVPLDLVRRVLTRLDVPWTLP